MDEQNRKVVSGLKENRIFSPRGNTCKLIGVADFVYRGREIEGAGPGRKECKQCRTRTIVGLGSAGQHWDINVIDFFAIASLTKMLENYGLGIGLREFLEKCFFLEGEGVRVATSFRR